MKLSSRNKVSPEFNMSSMTDLVFLLLIFFMLTSTLVTPAALDVVLPKSKAQTVKKATISVTIDEDFQYSVGSNVVSVDEIETYLLQEVAKNAESVVVLRVDESVPTGKTVQIMDIAYRNRIKLVLATDPK
jgi:biopolymer transport protein ExbD